VGRLVVCPLKYFNLSIIKIFVLRNYYINQQKIEAHEKYSFGVMKHTAPGHIEAKYK
jgi:hypothetical protein